MAFALRQAVCETMADAARDELTAAEVQLTPVIAHERRTRPYSRCTKLPLLRPCPTRLKLATPKEGH